MYFLTKILRNGNKFCVTAIILDVYLAVPCQQVNLGSVTRVSCEQGTRAATVAAATATCTEQDEVPEVSAEHYKLTQLKQIGETNDEAADDRRIMTRIRYQNLYFEYFNGEAHEMIQARENGLYPPCGGKPE